MPYSKTTTLGWEFVCIILAFAAGNIANTIIEAINKMGSLFYGPIIATFMLAIFTNRTNTIGINLGIIAGVLCNIVLWMFFSDVVFWFWWNFTGFIVTCLVAYNYSILFKHGHSPQVVELSTITYNNKEALILAGYFLLIVLFSSIIAML